MNKKQFAAEITTVDCVQCSWRRALISAHAQTAVLRPPYPQHGSGSVEGKGAGFTVATLGDVARLRRSPPESRYYHEVAGSSLGLSDSHDV